MAIKNKDGTVYTLRGPNPLMKAQQEWNKEMVKLFNLGWKSEVVTDERSPTREFEENLIDIGEELELYENEPEEPQTKVIPARDFLKEINEEPVPVVEQPKPKPVPVVEEPKVEDEPVQINVDKKTARLLKERGVEYHCAPAVGKKVHKDALYGSSYTTTRYGEKYIFDAVIVDQSDFQLQFWCVRPITVDSIIYRRDPEGGERWWRISEVEPKSGGYLAIANISELNPDFS